MELNKIYQGDCLEVLKTFPDGCVDLVVTSPPYNLGDNHHTGTKKVKAYSDNIPENVYQELEINVLLQIHRVLRPTGSLLYNHKNRIRKGVQITPYEWLLKTPFVVKQEIVWFNRSQNFDKIRFYPMTERVYWLAKSPAVKLSNAISHHDVFNSSEWPPEGTSKIHKRAFPVQMVADLIGCFPNAKIVLDPFVGSGTTAIAALQTGRNYIGIELSPEYVALSEQRIADYKLNDLF